MGTADLERDVIERLSVIDKPTSQRSRPLPVRCLRCPSCDRDIRVVLDHSASADGGELERQGVVRRLEHEDRVFVVGQMLEEEIAILVGSGREPRLGTRAWRCIGERCLDRWT